MDEKIKVQVVRNFTNKYSKNKHFKGDILEITESRLADINSAGYGILVKEIKETTQEK